MNIFNSSAKCRVILILIIHFLILQHVQGKNFDQRDIRKAVETWVRYETADANPTATIEELEAIKIDNETFAYIAHFSVRGFCLCGANEKALPVYYYSPKGIYDPKNPVLQAILFNIVEKQKTLNLYPSEIMSIPSNRDQFEKRILLWKDLINGRMSFNKTLRTSKTRAEPDSMVLNLTSHWHQGNPYNDDCPVLTPPNEHTVTGCVATATSQIMYYWKWPESGTGASTNDRYEFRWRSNWDSEPLGTNPNIPENWYGGNRLRWDAGNGGRLLMSGYWDFGLYRNKAKAISKDSQYLTAIENLWNRLQLDHYDYTVNYSSEHYIWEYITDRCVEPQSQREVAKLCFNVAVAAQTNFGITGSASGLEIAASALKDNFRYHPDVYYSENGVVDTTKMVEEIQWLRPLGFEAAGHAWVVYGYHKTKMPQWQFKVNLGWGGSQDDWYTWDDVAGLNHTQRYLIYIAPVTGVYYVGNSIAGSGTPKNPFKKIEQAINQAPSDATLIFKAGSVNTFSSNNLVINKKLTLKGRYITIPK